MKPDHVATFLGRKLHGNYRDEIGNDFSTRIEGTRIRHRMGPASIKGYDKFSLVMRIETTSNDITFFKHHRKVEQRDGTTVYQLAPLKKNIYSLSDRADILRGANTRYLDFIASLDDPSEGNKHLTKITETKVMSNRSYKGFHFFSVQDQRRFEAIVRGEFTIYGLRTSHLRQPPAWP